MSPQSERLLAAAGQAHVQGRLKEAEVLAHQSLAEDPTSLQAHLLLGVLAGKQGRSEEAFPHFEAVLAGNPESFEALFWMSMLFRRGGDIEKAVLFAERASRIRPVDAFGLNNLGLCYLDALRLTEAVEAFQSALRGKPDSGPTYHNLGTALYMLGRNIEAAKAFDRSLQLQPNSIDSYLSLGQVMIDLTQPEQATGCARKALTLDSRSVEGHLLLASALAEQNLTQESEEHLKKAIELDPQSGKASGLLGLRFQSTGRFEDANRHLRKSMELEPRQGFAYFAYAHNNKVSESDRTIVGNMEELVAENRLPPRELAFLRYGLGRAYESLGEFEKAMRHFDEANLISRAVKFGDVKFDGAAYEAEVDRLIATYSEGAIETLAAAGDPSDVPIVIVGMMRSGTTLAEQILSSHPKIGPAGEQRFWLLNRQRIIGDPKDLPTLASEYVRTLQRVAPGSPKVTDKNPGNYELVGPIHCALPNARIVHMRRNPVDTCLSIYLTPNRVRVPFAYDRDNIVFAYRQYQRLMEHWRAAIPADRLLEINYEDVVADRESQARRMLSFIGLEWDDAVLHHEKNERTVLTPSNWQVRQPIYTGSVDRWRRYEPWLGAFDQLR